MQSNDNDDGWLATIEEQYLQAIAAEPDYERQYLLEKDTATRNVWGSFQESATSIAQLYKEKLHTDDTGALWIPFQTAAGTVTSLYKESCDGMKRTNEAAVQYGHQRRTRELADWARNKRRRYIRREELLSYLAGKPPPPIHHHNTKNSSHHHHHLHHRDNHHNNHHNHHHHHNNMTAPKGDLQHTGLNNSLLGGQHQTAPDLELHTFKEALARRPRGPELYAFVTGEIARHCKRPASPLDINMDVQNISSKRQRFL